MVNVQVQTELKLLIKHFIRAFKKPRLLIRLVFQTFFKRFDLRINHSCPCLIYYFVLHPMYAGKKSRKISR